VRSDTDWVIAARRRWGWCGVQAIENGEVVGALLLTPDETGREQNALVRSLWVAHPRHGLGRRLIQSGCAGLVCRDVTAIISPGAISHFNCQLPPRAFLRHVGFNWSTGYYRLELNSTVIEKKLAAHVMRRLLRTLNPINPEPATRNPSP
jgi:hypothetical protein